MPAARHKGVARPRHRRPVASAVWSKRKRRVLTVYEKPFARAAVVSFNRIVGDHRPEPPELPPPEFPPDDPPELPPPELPPDDPPEVPPEDPPELPPVPPDDPAEL